MMKVLQRPVLRYRNTDKYEKKKEQFWLSVLAQVMRKREKRPSTALSRRSGSSTRRIRFTVPEPARSFEKRLRNVMGS